MKKSNQTDIDRETLDWFAFRYVAGELSGDETAEFELRLALEQDAREAVAAAVELTQVVAECASEPVVVKPFNWRAAIGWASIATATCIACVYVSLSEQQREHSGSTRATSIASENVEPMADSLELALLWSETRDDVVDTVESDELWSGQDADEVSAAVTDDLATEEVLEAPDWMLVGIRSLEEDDSEMPNDMGTDEGEES